MHSIGYLVCSAWITLATVPGKRGYNLVAGVVPAFLRLPGSIPARKRIVRIKPEVLSHIAQRHPDNLIFSLTHMPYVLGNPQYLGHRPDTDPRRVEFVAHVGQGPLLLVAVKFLDERNEAWLSTAHLIKKRYLTRRMRAGTMRAVGRGP